MEYEKVFAMSVGKVFPFLYAKAERKGRSRSEVDAVIGWLTGYTPEEVAAMMEKNVSYREFFEGAAMNPEAFKVKGTICGIRIEEIEDPLMKKIRQLDKLVDELAKGKPLEKITHRK